MRTYNHIFESETVVDSFLENIFVEDSDKILIRIHSGIHNTREMNSLVKYIKTKLPKANVIGCSVQYVINNGMILEDRCLISVTVLEKIDRVLNGHISCLREDGSLYEGKELGKKLLDSVQNTGNVGFVLIFFPTKYSKIEAVIKEVNANTDKIKMLGGAAFGAPKVSTPYVIDADGAYEDDFVYYYLEAPNLLAHGDYACGIEGVGRRGPIQADGIKVKTVDDTPSAQWYASLLGEEELLENPAITEAFPIVINYERELAYHVTYEKNEETGEYYLETYPELKNGTPVSAGYFNPKKIYDELSKVVDDISKSPAETIFLYDCHARAGLLSNCARWEIGTFKSTNASGALLGGEIIAREDSNFYANYTFVITALSEKSDAFFPLELPDISSIQALQEENLNTLNKLLLNSNKSLNDELAARQNEIKDAVFFNPVIGIDNQIKLQYDITESKLDKVALLYLNNEKMLRLFSGVTETYSFLANCYHRLQLEFIRQGIFFYSYQDTSVMVAGTNKVSEDEFEILIDKIYDYLNKEVFEDITLSYTAVSYFGTEDVINQLELALEYARSRKKTRLRFSEYLKQLDVEKENIHMLWILREALVHKRVKPYFQEIHSNKPGKRRLFEALMRITDEDGKLYFPDQFLPIAKEYDLYDRISELMVSVVMEHFKDRDSRVSINLNVQDIYNRNMLSLIFKNMKNAPNPNNYVFEIVEGEAVDDYEYIRSFADRIHEYGGKFAIDDFGSGYSNLIHLFRLDADYIKIDGEVIKAVSDDSLVRDFIGFMHNWCLHNDQAIICEYVENEQIQSILEEIGISYSQGYYFSKPHPWGPEDE